MIGADHCFPAELGEHPKVLILGSLPGQRSLQEQRYYAHPRNAFWPIMTALLKLPPEADYAQRMQALNAQGIALWDVVASGRRVGSLDSAIEETSISVNDIGGLIEAHPSLRRICFNGGKAEQTFRRYLLKAHAQCFAAVTLVRLPSTSPAYAGLSFAGKLAAWRKALADYLS